MKRTSPPPATVEARLVALALLSALTGCAAPVASSASPRSHLAPWAETGPLGGVAYGASPAINPTAALPVSALQGESSWRRPALGTTHVLVGAQQYEDSDFWDPLEDGWFVGLDSSYENVDDWIGIEWGGALRFADGDRPTDGPQTPGVLDYRLDSDIEAYEASLGIRRTFFRRSSLRPYVGVGASAIYYDLVREEKGAPVPPSTTNYSDKIRHKRVTFGLYAHAGIEWQLSEYILLGVDARVLRGTDLPNMMGNGDLDCERVSLFFGLGG